MSGRIQTEIIDPFIIKNIKDTSQSVYFWRKVSNYTESSAKLIIVLQSLVTFAAATYEMPYLAFVGGSLSVISISLLGYAKYAAGESKERNTELNVLLKYKGLEQVPDVTVDIEAQN